MRARSSDGAARWPVWSDGTSIHGTAPLRSQVAEDEVEADYRRLRSSLSYSVIIKH
jgi:hypothetical protein